MLKHRRGSTDRYRAQCLGLGKTREGRKAGPLRAVWAPGASERRGEPSRQIGQSALVAVDGEQEPLWLEDQRAGGPRAPAMPVF